ncbi:bifunctional 3-(3-hydroxy-phenyl)propionate/3-hydroxycinnamic acid hydroxylase [Micromonospora sp. Llam7]|uniref:bifunctional 3-(3-hydroxy-phenyl)propionate/3-hydroxycinnamic acid hydroxylase MhpA n=1 Tax=Micromonospora tarapacensis TaxID=2835305 RepID=UPI001C83E37D|nr:bifunctional 3-(3-hydroxy-phenyl)propionate/3-hydroxycinnamic acid hydroxylase [Micromonospora tarapacensis]MBX7267418.1 bifunctional 3-(3-hydroxy-phenyl)propionate/3-hydroxycinnamic acid hydroxylase [Micromonospora tarapacensis]
MTAVPVAIVGAGPTGLTAATLLAQYGVGCLVLERWASVYPLPRAVALDDEVHRVLARLGIREEFAAVSRPHRGLRLVDRSMRVLAEFPRDTTPGRHGFPQGSMFDQPELEAILRRNLTEYDTVTLRGNTEVTALTQDGDGVRIDVTDTTTGEHDVLRAAYVLGCDGANSLSRTSIGAAMRDLGFTQRWLVIDVTTRADLGQWDGVHQLCDPARAATYMRVGKTRYRWEFQLAPGESADDCRDPARLHPLISPWTGDIPIAELEIVRASEYTFRAQLADRWRDRRVFLLGDAAHLTPPFIGQGMGAGLRDAMNLAWKLAGVLDGTLRGAVLDTYEIERRQHARAMIRLAKLVGTAMTAGGRAGDVIRRAVAPRLHLVPGLADLTSDSETPALRRSALVLRPRLRRTLAGRLCPNAILDGDRRLDDVAAGRFALVTSTEPPATLRAAVEKCGSVVVATRPGSELHRWLRNGRVDAAVVRPDGIVLGAGRRLSALCTFLPGFDGNLPRHPAGNDV